MNPKPELPHPTTLPTTPAAATRGGADARLTHLQALALGLARALTIEEVAEVTIRVGIPAMEAEFGAVMLLNETGTTFRTEWATGYRPELVHPYNEFPADADYPVCDAVRGGGPLFLTRDERDERYPGLGYTKDLGAGGALAALPLVGGGGTFGCLALSWPGDRGFAAADRAFMGIVAEMVAQNLERARLFDAERRARERAEQELVARRQAEERYRGLFDVIDEGFCLIEVLFDAQDRPVDYLFLEVNPVFEAQTGIRQAEGRTVRELVPDIERHWVEIYGRVARTGEPVRFVEGSEALGRWFDVYACRVGGGESRKVAILFSDITERRRAEEELRERNRFIERVADLMPTLLYVYDVKERRNVYINRQMESLLGYTTADTQAMGDSVLPTLIHPEDFAGVSDYQRRFATLAEGEIAAFEYRMRHADGLWRWFYGRDMVLERDPDGAPRLMVGTAEDVTERRRAEDALRERTAELEALMEGVPVALFVSYDPDCRRITANRAGYALFRAEPGSNVSKSAPEGELTVPYRVSRSGVEVPTGQLPMQTAAAMGREVRNVELDLLFADGEVRHVTGNAVPLFDGDGRVRGCVGAYADITGIKEQQARIADLNARLRRAISEGNHRIKNNLQVLSALIEVQAPVAGEPVPGSVLERVRQHVRTLASLHDLLTVSLKSDEGLANSISLRSALERLVAMLQTAAGPRVQVVRADDARISVRQGGTVTLLVNEIVQNAVKHGDGDVEIAVTVRDGSVRLEVADGGPGFPPGFDPTVAANTGLELIESMGRWDLQGDVVYGNRPEGGAQVTVTFPLSEVEES